MLQQVVRKIRTAEQEQQTDSFDNIKNPNLLAHALVSLNFDDDKVRPYEPYLRSSSIYSMCLREQYLGYLHEISPKRPSHFRAQMRLTFDIGHAIHVWFQNSKAIFGRRLLGLWECQACGLKRFGRMPTKHCPRCYARPQAFRYYEFEFRVKEPLFGIGHVDAFLEVEKGDIRICDIKTIARKEWDALEDTPQIEHVYQVADYILLYNECKDKLPIKLHPKRGIVMYVAKEYTPGEFPIKAFHVNCDGIVKESLMRKHKTFAEAIRNGKTPEPLQECVKSDFQSSRPRRCPVSGVCRKAT